MSNAPLTIFQLKDVGRPNAWDGTIDIAVYGGDAGHLVCRKHAQPFTQQTHDRPGSEERRDLRFMIRVRSGIAARMIVEEYQLTVPRMQCAKGSQIAGVKTLFVPIDDRFESLDVGDGI